MAYSRKESVSTKNTVVYDSLGNTLLPNGLRVLGLQTAGFVKTTAEGQFYIDTSGGGSGGSGGHIIYNESGTALTQQPGLKFVRLSVTNDGTNSLTVISRPADTYVGLSAPSNPIVGDVWTNSETWKTYKYYDGYWVEYSGGSSTVTGGGGGGSGTVTSVSVVSANGFAGTVANSSTTPAITISTSITGILKGNGTTVTAATLGVDYLTSIYFKTDYDSAITGIRNSINKVFTLTTNFVSNTTRVYVNGVRYSPGASNDYVETGTNQITFALAPDVGDIIVVDYIKQ